MNKLETIRAKAKATANRSGIPVAIYNFNRYSPLYVLRDFCPVHSAKASEFVERVDPDPQANFHMAAWNYRQKVIQQERSDAFRALAMRR